MAACATEKDAVEAKAVLPSAPGPFGTVWSRDVEGDASKPAIGICRALLDVVFDLQDLAYTAWIHRGASPEVEHALASVGDQFGSAQITAALWAMLAATNLFHWTPRRWLDYIASGWERLSAPVQGVVLGIVVLALMSLASWQAVPFQYFQF